MVMHHLHRTSSFPMLANMPQRALPPDALTRALARRLAQATGGRAALGAWTRLDGSRIRAEILHDPVSPALPWNLAFFDLKEGNLLLAWLDADSLALRLTGELHGIAALNVGDALLEGLELGSRRFVLDFELVDYIGQDALHLVAMLWRELEQEGRQQHLELRHAEKFPELRKAVPACC